jgi:hypothetical protein
MIYKVDIFSEFGDNGLWSCISLVGANSRKGGHHPIQGLPKQIRFADTDSSVGERIGGRGGWFQWY